MRHRLPVADTVFSLASKSDAQLPPQGILLQSGWQSEYQSQRDVEWDQEHMKWVKKGSVHSH